MEVVAGGKGFVVAVAIAHDFEWKEESLWSLIFFSVGLGLGLLAIWGLVVGYRVAPTNSSERANLIKVSTW